MPQKTVGKSNLGIRTPQDLEQTRPQGLTMPSNAYTRKKIGAQLVEMRQYIAEHPREMGLDGILARYKLATLKDLNQRIGFRQMHQDS